ncbi:outer membrane beta-barrel protein [Limnovirga soli]|uniref:Outer membrane beta-barrel protein n=1 Tax=Limnovirga soli TaxID=2656915 RepID=A0A8J8JX92_9BACT|nr:outer membrane beta-barrel protein [Limnovirga soli]NNV56121.1 outer membrane beta-barrel protein [Limnovirga soli]
MGNRLYHNDFEKYLKDEADDFRMYPSEQLWGNIQQEIHGHQKWPALTVISIFIISALVVGTVLLKPHTEIGFNTPKSNNTTAVATLLTDHKKPKSNTKISGSAMLARFTNRAVATPLVETYKEEQSPATTVEILTSFGQITSNTITSATPIVDQTQEQLIALQNNTAASLTNVNDAAQPTLIASLNTEKANNNKLNNFVTTAYAFNRDFVNRVIEQKSNHKFYGSTHLPANFSSLLATYSAKSGGAQIDPTLNIIKMDKSERDAKERSPLSKIRGRSSKLDFQFFITPSISYRRLVDNANGELTKSYVTALPLEANYVVDVNNVIQHRPATGYEVGFTLGYNINNKFAIRSGLQFNMRQYNINAYVHSTEPASIALVNRDANNIINTVSAFRNNPGSDPVVLKNRYYEISMPIGVDWRPVNNKISWGIAAAIQPTYSFDKEPFIITSNYKNYADGSVLMRNWNVNANVETYIGYNAGKYRWQLGPQVRYQALPTMSSSYPIKEYLIDYGIKLSLIKSLR